MSIGGQNGTVIVNQSIVTNEILKTTDSATSLSIISRELDPDDVTISEFSVTNPENKSNKDNKDPSGAVLKKNAENKDAHSRPGTSKARPIPEMPNCDIPRDPDKDNPNVDVCIKHLTRPILFLPYNLEFFKYLCYCRCQVVIYLK